MSPRDAVLKRIDYAYRPDGYVAAVTRFAGAGVNPIGIPKAAYDSMGRLTRLVLLLSRVSPTPPR